MLFIRVDELTNGMALLKEENQKLKDEIDSSLFERLDSADYLPGYVSLSNGDEQARIDLEQVRDKIWTIYRDLRISKDS